eukprot:6058163-Amphidinium_carterae.3
MLTLPRLHQTLSTECVPEELPSRHQHCYCALCKQQSEQGTKLTSLQAGKHVIDMRVSFPSPCGLTGQAITQLEAMAGPEPSRT